MLADVRDFGCTYFNYVGKPLSYILATPEQPDDADNPLKFVFGNEAAERDIQRFGERFGVIVVDNYGSTEGGATVVRDPEQPPGSLGRAGDGIEVLDPETGERCPPARFDDDGVLLNPDEAIGEMVSTTGLASFEGYYKNDEANRERVRDGVYWTGDLAYIDEAGFVYFAGRDFEWLRVDGENFAAAPVERILARHPGVGEVAVYAVPDEVVGDQVMAAVGAHRRRVRPGRPRRVPRRAGRPRHQVGAPLRPAGRRPAGHPDQQGPQARAAGRGLGRRRPRLVAARAQRSVPTAGRRGGRRPPSTVRGGLRCPSTASSWPLR